MDENQDPPAARSAGVPPETADRSPTESGEFRRVVFYSLLTSLCPLIPIPFLDDWAINHLRKRLTFDLSRRHDVPLGSSEVALLAVGEKEELTVQGCMKGCFNAAVIKPIVKITLKLLQKVFRKILFFLTLKDAVDTFSRTFHEGFLIDHSLCCVGIEPSREACLRARLAIEDVVREVDTRPIARLVRQSMRGSRRLLLQASRLLSKVLEPLRNREMGEERSQTFTEPLDTTEEEAVLGGLVDRLVQRLSQQQGYLLDLRQRLERRLERDRTDAV